MLAVLLVLLLLPVAITLLLHVRTIQNYVVDTGLNYLSERAETQFSVEDVRFSLFNRFVSTDYMSRIMRATRSSTQKRWSFRSGA